MTLQLGEKGQIQASELPESLVEGDEIQSAGQGKGGKVGVIPHFGRKGGPLRQLQQVGLQTWRFVQKLHANVLHRRLVQAPCLQHRACPKCGFYKGREVMQVEQEA